MVFLRQEIDKHSTREVYLVTDVSEDGKHLTVQKLLHVLSRSPAKLQNTKYRVKQTDVIITPNQSFYIDIPSDPPNYDEPIEVDYKHTNLDTDPPTPEIWFTTPLETEQNEVTREQLPLLTTLEPLVAIAPMPGLGQIHYGEEGANPEDNAGSRNLIRPPSPRSVDLSWDNYQSSPTFSHSRRPLSSPPTSPGRTSSDTSPRDKHPYHLRRTRNLSVVTNPEEKQSSTTDEDVFSSPSASADPDWPGTPQWRHKKRKNRKRLDARTQPGRPLSRAPRVQVNNDQQVIQAVLPPPYPRRRGPEAVEHNEEDVTNSSPS